jgi:hypothetical protein
LVYDRDDNAARAPGDQRQGQCPGPGRVRRRASERLLADRQKIRILEAYDRLASDPEHWRDYLAELGEWEVTAGDGLAEAPPGSRP